MASRTMLSNFRFHNQHGNGRVVQDLGEALPDDTRGMTEAGAVENVPPHEPAFPSSQMASMVSYLMSSCTPSLKAHTSVYMLPGLAVGCRATHQTRLNGTRPSKQSRPDCSRQAHDCRAPRALG